MRSQDRDRMQVAPILTLKIDVWGISLHGRHVDLGLLVSFFRMFVCVSHVAGRSNGRATAVGMRHSQTLRHRQLMFGSEGADCGNEVKSGKEARLVHVPAASESICTRSCSTLHETSIAGMKGREFGSLRSASTLGLCRLRWNNDR